MSLVAVFCTPEPRNRYSYWIAELNALKALGYDVIEVRPGEWNIDGYNLTGIAPAIRKLKTLVPQTLWNTLKHCMLLSWKRAVLKKSMQLVEGAKVELVFERWMDSLDVGRVLAHKFDVPRILIDVDPIGWEGRKHQPSFLNRALDHIDVACVRTADHIIAVSGPQRDWILRTFQVPENKVSVLPMAVDTRMFDISCYNRGAVKQKLGLQGFIVVGYVGGFHAYHGVESLVEAARQLEGRGVSNLRYLLVGDSNTSSASRIKELAKANDLQQFFHFTGWAEPECVPLYVAAMDIGVVPSSNWWGSPTKIFEYGAMGLAVVAPKVGPVTELLRDEVDALLISPGDGNDLSTAILRLATDTNLRQRLAENWKRKVLAYYTREHWKKAIGRIIEEVVEEK